MSQVERTLSIVKPDAVAAGAAGDILSRFEKAGLTIIALKKMRLTEAQAQGFYAVHKERPFFGDLVKFMTEGPIVVIALEGENSIAKNRELMGPTDSTQAEPGTIRGDHGTDIERNAVHGSDAPETARIEIAYFFNATEIQALIEALPA
ncbi:MAG: nucleoside-diphosphate kinase [Deltaproteobacteria bacterium]|nr:nucleoside-diphosphate kinase [Deltaproteobacteria bacterium]